MAPRPGTLAGAAECTVVALARAGDRACFEELVRRRQPQVRNLLRRLCRDPALADDLSQQTFLQAWRRLAALQSPAAFGAWLRRIAVHSWLQHARRGDAPQLAYDASEEWAVGQCDASGERIDLDCALAQLPPLVRLCIVLAHAEGMSHSEIAATTRLPLGTVKSHIARGTAKLRELLAAYTATGESHAR
ncbi:MAG: sigma-70 family RNA polymerase sigma factor [Steroidobacteraceae bacterium]